MQEHSIEQGFDRLEEIIKGMESKDITLEDSFALFKEGMEELEYCNSRIDATKKAVLAITESGALTAFDEE